MPTFCPRKLPDGEQVRFAVSEPGDPLRYTPLNGGNPVLISTVGEGGVRDPFLVRSPLTGTFHLLATVLRVHGQTWERTVRRGSRSIVIWDSKDLLDWSAPRLVELMGPEAGNTWAPEAVFDTGRNSYVVFWASALYEGEDRSTEVAYQRMMYSTTADFLTFTKPAIYLDRGHSIIDSTLIEHDGTIFRFSKDERTRDASRPKAKFVFQERGNSVLDPDYVRVREGIGAGVVEHGEGPIALAGPDERNWYLFVDHPAHHP